ncbi:LCP family protein [Salibacterium halotolerans]|uniref:Cell envelope-related function transcriptional attenuator common domain-containing protein n=1 Tax=Salibacterium halotolerans TaxID=1884432 RepID=A0A1I5T8C9_9BACI|nr:LCP family protein [Salibacterium halotolerans]SFP79299.1 cell envelope-related function transcriptional attenuator common domain-containing protein [Salibacterium halotolerans]
MAREKRRYRRSSSSKKKFYFLTFLIAVLAVTATFTTLSKDGRPFGTEEQNNNDSTDPMDNNSNDNSGESPPESSEENNTGGSNDNADNDPDENLTFLLVGVDNEEESGAQRTDTIMLANYNPENNNVQLASILRDSYVDIPGHENNKINASFAYGGVELLRDTIEKNFDIAIDHYATVNFDGFVEVVDAVAPDGIEVDIQERMYYNDHSGNVNIDFQPGTQKLDGEEALEYVRYRGGENNDFGRVERQQKMLNLLKDEVLSFSSVTKIPQLISAVRPNIDTDVSTSRMFSLGKDVLLSEINDINTMRIPLEDTYQNERYTHAGLVLEMDKQTNKEKLQQFLNQSSTDDIQTASDESKEDDSSY